MNLSSSTNAVLIFSDGSFLEGYGIGEEGIAIGEICFNTSMTGYQEIMTDPSYYSQIINFTFPHIGNTGYNAEDYESDKIQVSGVILANKPFLDSNYRSKGSFENWLQSNKKTGIYGLDTRYITKKIRDSGPQNILIYYSKNKSLDKSELKKLQKKLKEHPKMSGLELTDFVSTKKNYEFKSDYNLNLNFKCEDSAKIAVIDFGVKKNILRVLSRIAGTVRVFSPKTNIFEISKFDPNGILLSNGPGDPKQTFKKYNILLKELVELNIPIFGICLGHQLIAQLFGAKTFKMDFGQRGANQPVLDISSKKVEITSQNHGFCVDTKNLPKELKLTHKSLFDNSCEGIAHYKKNIFSVQFHPESSPGPKDSIYLFEKFRNLLKK